MSSPDGKTYFLGIGIDRYHHWTPLRNAVRDVRAIAEVLVADYGLDAAHVHFLCDDDATRAGIIHRLEELAETVTDQDALIIYYAGHGYLHRSTRGFWVPVDAPRQQIAPLIRNSTIRDYIGDIPSLHTLLVSDSCFSGSLFVRGERSGSLDAEELLRLPSRWAVSSGRQDEPVADGPRGGHSPFAQSILDVLRQSERELLTTNFFYEQVREQTRATYQQLPDGGPLVGVGHKRGQFVFRRRSQDKSVWNNCRNQDTVAAYEQYLAQFPNGQFISQATQRLSELKKEQAAAVWATIRALPDDKLVQVDTKRQRLRDFIRTYEDSPHFEPALQLGQDLDWKREFLHCYDREFALLAFARKDTPYREAALARLSEMEGHKASTSQSELHVRQLLSGQINSDSPHQKPNFRDRDVTMSQPTSLSTNKKALDTTHKPVTKKQSKLINLPSFLEKNKVWQHLYLKLGAVVIALLLFTAIPFGIWTLRQSEKREVAATDINSVARSRIAHSPIVSRYGRSGIITNEGYQEIRDQLIREARSNDLLEIIGFYYPGEEPPEGFENMGLARAEAIANLLSPPLDRDRLQLRARLVGEGEGAPSADVALNAVDFSWVAPPNPKDEADKIEAEELEDRIVITLPFRAVAIDRVEPAIDGYLTRLAAQMEQDPEMRIQITGHTDNVSSDEFNLKLGQRRADYIKGILVDKGVAADRITTRSRGETQAIASNETEIGRAENRRVELIFLK